MSTPDTFDILAHAAELREAGRPFALATVTLSQRPTSARLGAKAVITPDGALFGWVGGACAQPSVVRHAREALKKGEPRLLRLSPDAATVDSQREGVLELPMTCHSGGTIEIFIEPFLPDPYLIAVGDSPIARELASLGRSLGFRTAAVGSATPAGDEHYTEVNFGALSRHRVPFVVVATMGTDDETALVEALSLEAPYIAMVGSRRRFESVVDFLRARGVEEDRIHAIRAPAGLDIGAETPAEIAVSILAEIVQARRDLQSRGELTVLDREIDTLHAPRIVIDPVCGMEVDLATTRHTLEIDGETVGFCCAGCMDEYQRRLAS